MINTVHDFLTEVKVWITLVSIVAAIVSIIGFMSQINKAANAESDAKLALETAIQAGQICSNLKGAVQAKHVTDIEQTRAINALRVDIDER